MNIAGFRNVPWIVHRCGPWHRDLERVAVIRHFAVNLDVGVLLGRQSRAVAVDVRSEPVGGVHHDVVDGGASRRAVRIDEEVERIGVRVEARLPQVLRVVRDISRPPGVDQKRGSVVEDLGGEIDEVVIPGDVRDPAELVLRRRGPQKQRPPLRRGDDPGPRHGNRPLTVSLDLGDDAVHRGRGPRRLVLHLGERRAREQKSQDARADRKLAPEIRWSLHGQRSPR